MALNTITTKEIGTSRHSTLDSEVVEDVALCCVVRESEQASLFAMVLSLAGSETDEQIIHTR